MREGEPPPCPAPLPSYPRPRVPRNPRFAALSFTYIAERLSEQILGPGGAKRGRSRFCQENPGFLDRCERRWSRGIETWHRRTCGLASSGRMRLQVRVRGLDAACRMVALGAGVAVVPEAAARRYDALALVQLDDPWAERRLMVVVRRLDALPAHARRLVERLVAAA